METIYFTVSKSSLLSFAEFSYGFLDREKTRKNIRNAVKNTREQVCELNVVKHKEFNVRSMSDYGTGWKMYVKKGDEVFQYISELEIEDKTEKAMIEMLAEFL